ncbi:hypothetical protein CH249_26675 [Rhodococcus sp. 05-2255-3B1]|uniref:DUF1254 domain-containing protein n=1 Tax=unclassified Rhodococcus (in: high G+C Gram-positive bacteria) TaxID=192944 RepID=UPI000B9C0F65|nr:MULTISPECIES: DUF1214 domain-containing protein [unclassified Rhodococcus (in: high G+C Gram-positive bacteria)]OZE03953.1 hypothetical protein CH249_26675 [Rhodococcus sp. 05-2255-3B1]OZE10023.1 hypothetical protein CH250_14030 [Rhodococcus sp. 05-2255-3C]OZE15790.1 hypothetical protein CH255_21055 [Rhodococcus sp. 05-2255-2A2]
MTNQNTPTHPDLRDDARALQVWGFPVVFAQRLRLRFTSPSDPHVQRTSTSAGAPLNHLGHQRELADPTLTAGVAPNVDTLYSLAFVDLDSGTFELRLPDFADRYYSVQVGEADSSTNTVLGHRTHGSRVPSITLFRRTSRSADTAADGWVACRSRFVMIAIRILVDPSREGDLHRVHELQNLIVLTGPSSPTAEHADLVLSTVERSDEQRRPVAFLAALDHAIGGLADSDVPSWVRLTYRRLVDALEATVDRDATEQNIADGLLAGLEDIAVQVKSMGRIVNGWAINDAGAEFGSDHLLRAAVAYSQIYINPAAEASYPVCEQDEDGRPLNGANNYAITFRAGHFPPAKYFWSVTVYHAKGLLYANELDRYAITDRTPDLARDEDGSLTVVVRTTRPAPGTTVNWIPCPRGDFRLMLRLYGPRPGSWSPPPVIRLE